ncbi:hypothetical protein [Ahrensia marina]|uniref:Uncharacterized protein n=1 Tax=Ahrensia marina TaxID=1514904 RepID=A0A0N0E6M7_9HYPH|nr:hypothetical protein [Ahrensia marina]KPB00172.1 hypothetical protein SU32_15305 [Ahrensia marina]
MKKLPLIGAGVPVIMSVLMTANIAYAGEELLIRTATHFNDCPAVISTMLQQLGANSNRVRTKIDTGAHYYVTLESHAANLEFRCNAVSELIEVVRVTPGTLQVASQAQVPAQ